MERGGSRSPRNLKLEKSYSCSISKYTSLRYAIVEWSSNASNSAGNPLLRRAAMLYARAGAGAGAGAPPPRPTTFQTLIKACFGFNID